MITVDLKERIRRSFFLQRKSIRRISRELQRSRKTVRKAITHSGVPVYEQQGPRARPVLEPFTPLIDQWIEEDRDAPRKQRHTARRIFHRLKQEHEYRGTERTIQRYVRMKRGISREAFVPLGYDPGSVAQIDWGKAIVRLGGKLCVAHLFCAKLMASGRIFVRAFPHERQEAFFQGHIDFFDYIEGVCSSLTYDNLKTAVVKVLKGRSRVEQQEFVGLRSHYLFESIFCNPGKGSEKGGVENLVGFVRRNVFVPVPGVSGWEELNQRLLVWCRENDQQKVAGKTKAELFLEEKFHLLSLPARPYEACRTVPAKADKHARVWFDRCRYSTPIRYAHSHLLCKGYVDKIRIFSGHVLVAEHLRKYTPGEESLNPVHYFPLLEQKPRAWRQARPIRALELPPIFDRYCRELENRDSSGPKEFIRILRLLERTDKSDLASVLEKALKLRVFSFDGVVLLLHAQHEEPSPFASPTLTDLPHLNTYRIEPPNVVRFNNLLVKRSRLWDDEVDLVAEEGR
jgi:transposase